MCIVLRCKDNLNVTMRMELATLLYALYSVQEWQNQCWWPEWVWLLTNLVIKTISRDLSISLNTTFCSGIVLVVVATSTCHVSILITAVMCYFFICAIHAVIKYLMMKPWYSGYLLQRWHVPLLLYCFNCIYRIDEISAMLADPALVNFTYPWYPNQSKGDTWNRVQVMYLNWSTSKSSGPQSWVNRVNWLS